MKKEELQKMTRRRFLESAAVVGAVASAPNGEAGEVTETDPDRARLEKIVARYGSEIGDLRRVK
jgi:nitrous oxide reductase